MAAGAAYDAGSNLTRRTYPGGTVVDIAYDDDGRLATVTDPSGVATYAYDAAGQQTSLTRPNATSTKWTYDAAGRTTQISHRKGTL